MMCNVIWMNQVEKRLQKAAENILSELQAGSEWGSIEINWKVQNVNQDNSASWPVVMILIQSATRTLVVTSLYQARHFTVFLRLCDGQKTFNWCDSRQGAVSWQHQLSILHLSHSALISASTIKESDVSIMLKMIV